MSYHRRYKLKDDRFGVFAQTLREKAGLTQTDIAQTMGVSERTIQHWEAGTTYPTVNNLKKLLAIYLHSGSFTAGHELNEAQAFWNQATESSSARKEPFDTLWFTTLLQQQPFTKKVLHEQARPSSAPATSVPSSLIGRADWGEAVDVATFHGRQQELATLTQWVLDERCRVVTLLGMGGIGKTTLSIHFAQQTMPHFSFVFWRSLRNAPPLDELLIDCIQAIVEQQEIILPHNTEKRIALLIELLRKRRCLLVLDNVETLLQAGSMQSSYREGYEGYGTLIQRIAEITHQSCLLLTSREMLDELEPLEGSHAPVRALKLHGLDRAATQQLLKDKELFGEQQHWERFVQHYAGNPLALKMAAATIRDVFGGDIATFVHDGPSTIHTLTQLLDHQFTRLSPLEQAIMYWLAIERDLVPYEELSANFLSATFRKDMLSALKSLRRRSLVERGERGAVFTLQPVVMEYVSDQLVEHVCEEIITMQPALLLSHALMKAQSKDYIRESQIRMLIRPLLDKLVLHIGSELQIEQQLLLLTRQLREKPQTLQGYGGGNLINLLVCLKGHLRKADFSSLAIRQAYLQGIDAQDANFADALIIASTFMEPVETIASMALSPNGAYLAVGSFSGQICLWHRASGKLLLNFKGHNRVIWALAFSPDSQTLASAGYDTSIKLWHIGHGQEASGACLKILEGHERWVRSIIFSHAGSLLATCGDDATIRLWDVHTGTCMRVLHGHSGMIWTLALSPDSSLLASGGIDEMVRIWDVDTGNCLHILHKHTGMAMSVAFHPSGKLLASGGEDGLIHLWDVHTWSCMSTLRLHTYRASSIVFNADGSILACGSHDGAIELWQMTGEHSPQRMRTIPGHSLWVSTIAFDLNGLLASVSYSGNVKFWDIESGQRLGTFQGYSRVIGAIALSPDGRLLVHGDDHGMLRVWCVDSGEPIAAFRAHKGRIWSIAFTTNGKMIASGGDDESIKLWQVTDDGTEVNIRSLHAIHGHTTMSWSTTFSPDGKTLASSGFENIVKLWRIGENNVEESLKALHGHKNFVWSVAFSPDGKLLASGADDGEIKLWEVASGRCLITLHNSTSPISTLVFAPDGQTLLSSSNDEVVTQWHVHPPYASRQRLQNQGHINWPKTPAFNQTGTMFATGSDDHTVRLWHLYAEGNTAHLTNLRQHTGQVWSIAFSSDNHLLASGDDDGVIALWNLQTGCCVQVLRSDRPYERMNIRNINGLSEAQKASLRALGACEEA